MKRNRRLKGEAEEETASSKRAHQEDVAEDKDITFKALIVTACEQNDHEEALRLAAEWYTQRSHASESKPQVTGENSNIGVPSKASGSNRSGGSRDRGKDTFKLVDRVNASIKASIAAGVLATRHLDLAKTQYRDGRHEEAGLSLRLARKETEKVGITLPRQVKTITTEWRLGLVNALPDELLLDMFGQLDDTKDLLHCWRTDRRWNRILGDTLPQKTLFLTGNIRQIDQEWKKYGMLMRHAKVVRLSLAFRGVDAEDIGYRSLEASARSRRNHKLRTVERWESSSLMSTFPHDILEAFSYSSDSSDLDKPVWKCLTQCQKLKALRWTDNTDVRLKVGGTPLSKCRLETVRVRSPSVRISLEKQFEKICADAKVRKIINTSRH